MLTDARWQTVWSHRDALLRVARRRTPNDADAEDCVSEAMLRAVLHPGLDLDRAGPFLTSVTVRLCADLHRDRGRAARASVRWFADDRLVTTPETVVCDRAEGAYFARVAGWLLTPRERAAIDARAAGVHPAGVTRKSASAALTRARTKLKASQ